MYKMPVCIPYFLISNYIYTYVFVPYALGPGIEKVVYGLFI